MPVTDEMELVCHWARLALPVPCGIAGGLIEPLPPSSFAGEELLISRSIPKRQKEFRSGRAFAREALREISYTPSHILTKSGRDPQWPTGVIGSISHTDTVAIAIVARSIDAIGIGIDIEGQPTSEKMPIEIICRRDERQIDPFKTAPGIDSAMLHFVAKEAFYKCFFPVNSEYLDFQDVRLSFSGRSTFSATVYRGSDIRPLNEVYAGWYLTSQELCAAVCLSTAKKNI